MAAGFYACKSKTTSRKPCDDALSLRRDEISQISGRFGFSLSVSHHRLSSAAAHADWPFFLQRKDRPTGEEEEEAAEDEVRCFPPFKQPERGRDGDKEKERERERDFITLDTVTTRAERDSLQTLNFVRSSWL